MMTAKKRPSGVSSRAREASAGKARRLRHQELDRLADDLPLAVAEHRLGPGAEELHPPGGVGDHDGLRRDGHHPRQHVLAAAGGGLQHPKVGDVLHRAQHAQRLAVRAQDQLRLLDDPAHLAVRTQDAETPDAGLVESELLTYVMEQDGAIIRVRDVDQQPRIGLEVRDRIAGDPLAGG